MQSAMILIFMLLMLLPTPSMGQNQGSRSGMVAGHTPPQSGDVWTEPNTGMEFVWVSGGCFMMGSREDELPYSSSQLPRHEVCLDGFWMGKYEVTLAQFQKFRSGHDNGIYEFVHRVKKINKETGSPYYEEEILSTQSFNDADLPVVRVSWNDAMAFAGWLSGKGEAKFRLPSEAQWEYAVRAGKEYFYPWGGDKDRACEYGNVLDRSFSMRVKDDDSLFDCVDGHALTSPVGSFPANAFGIHDLVGNVSEFTEDMYAGDAYKRHSKDNPLIAAPDASAKHTVVVRGGSWKIIHELVHSSAARRFEWSHRNDDDLGFRLIRFE